MNVQLALEVKRRVLAKPRRVDMTKWKSRPFLFCGTTCCIAGHAIEASGGTKIDRGGPLPGRIARELLDIPIDEANLLFYLHAVEGHPQGTPYHELAIRLAMHKPRTREYAQVVAEAIDRCIARNSELPQTTEDKQFCAELGVTL